MDYFFRKFRFILKGEMLISSIIGIESRATMDMDTTIKDFKLDIEILNKILEEIFVLDVGDNVKFDILNIENIRENDDYGGMRVHISAIFDNMVTSIREFYDIYILMHLRENNISYKMLKYAI